jgi:hypothetical protein
MEQLPLISMVVECSECSEAWEPPTGDAAGDVQALGCRRCGGVVVIGELLEMGRKVVRR